jgi:tetratricopeptide (TPR) repeat protein
VRALRRNCSGLRGDRGLAETLATLRRGRGIHAGQKVLIVLDQFEQWLHAKQADAHAELVQALRQCDGERVQCLILVRDDFWLAVSRFMRELEVRLLERQNSALVDLFDLEHAHKVLMAFGRVFGRLPENWSETSKEQKEFLKQSVNGLAQESKIICVRLALFAEMMKGRAWTPATLNAMGGTEGVGLTFLEETFSAATAPPEHRLHQSAARAVLKALLPDTGTDIRGHVRSYAELLAASAYSSHSGDFDELLRILDSELRLITPTDPEGREIDRDVPSQVQAGQRYYQLTHDYLVHSLREWLARKQKETRWGRAELCLAERAALWNSKPEKRQLPDLWEWANIRRFTRAKDWTPAQRKMMKKANRFYIPALIGCLVLFLLLSSVAPTLFYLDQRNRHLQQQVSNAYRREEVRQSILEGQNAFTNKELGNARVNLARAQAKLGPFERSLRELHEQVWALQDQIERESEHLKARQSAQDTYQKFKRHHDGALFHATLATGESELANLKATREAVRNALSLFGVTLDDQVPLVPKTPFTESEQADILAGCYELLLILAQTEVQQPGQKLPDQLRLALHILDRAANLGYAGHPTQAYHLRRARYLEQLGNQAEAKKERERAERRPPATALDYYLVGDEHYKQEKMQEATQDFLRAVERQPDHFWARYFLALSYLRLERPSPELAMAHLTFCINQKADFIWLYLLRGFAHTQLHDFQAAEADLKTALQLLQAHPSNDARHVLYATRGVLSLEQGQLGKAVDDLQVAIQLKPHEYQAYVTLAYVYQKQKEWDKAQAQLDKAIQLEPELAILYRFRAQVHLERPDPDLDAALADYGEAIKLEATTGGGQARPSVVPRILTGRPTASLVPQKGMSIAPVGLVAAGSGDSPAAAIGHAGDRVSIANDYVERGRILHRGRRYQEAVTAYDEALKHDPLYANAHLWRAQTEFQLQNYGEAAHSIDQYLKQGGKPAVEVYRLRGFARAQLHQYREAIHDYTQALVLHPNDPATQAARGWAYVATEAYQLALPDFEEEIRWNPENGTFPASVASSMAMVSPLAQGPTLAISALASWRNGDAYNGRGYARVRLGEYRQAVEDAEMALKRGPQSARLLYDAARIYAQAVDKVQADPRQSNPRPIASTYQDRAVRLIRQSLELRPSNERRPFWRDTILLDRALSPIRGSTAFLSLASDYSQ